MKKAWNPIWIAVVSFFFTLLPGLVLMAFNYERLGKPKLKLPLIILAVLAFCCLIYLTSTLPKQYDWIFAVIHLGVPILIAYVQRPLYEQFLETSDNDQSESFLFPVLYSVLFLIVFIGGISGLNFYRYTQMKSAIADAEQYYYDGKLNESKTILLHLMEDHPSEKSICYNLATIYEAEQEKDSAKFYLRKILETHKDDEDAKEALYRINYGH